MTYPLTRDELLAVSNKQYTLDEFGEWAKNLAHINPKFVDAFVERHRNGWMAGPFYDATGRWEVEGTAVWWMDKWTQFWDIPAEYR